MTKQVPVIFHNLRGYDGHLIMKEISKFDVEIIVIPNGLEKYMAFAINKNLIFIDSMQFKNSGLDVLVKNLSNNNFKHLSRDFNGDLVKLVKQKGVYPYEYMDSFGNQLPDRSKLYSSLKNECISKKDHLQVNVWNMFKMNTMGDYHDLYWKTDVLLLVEKFTSTCLEYYGLDPCHYFSSPGLSWDSMLKMAKIELELISDTDMYLLKNELEEVFLILLKDIVKQIINTCNQIMLINQANLLCI